MKIMSNDVCQNSSSQYPYTPSKIPLKKPIQEIGININT